MPIGNREVAQDRPQTEAEGQMMTDLSPASLAILNNVKPLLKSLGMTDEEQIQKAFVIIVNALQEMNTVQAANRSASDHKPSGRS